MSQQAPDQENLDSVQNDSSSPQQSHSKQTLAELADQSPQSHQLPSQAQQPSQPQSQQPLPQQAQDGPLDSVSLGQLRKLVNANRPKPRRYDFPTNADTDDLSNEIDEFYSYVEVPQTAENRAAWEEWCSLPPHVRSGGFSTSAEPNDAGADSADLAAAVAAAAAAADADLSPGQLAQDGGALGLGLGIQANSGPGEAGSTNNIRRKRSGSIIGEWTTLPSSVRRRTFQSLLSTLEVRDPEARFRASRALLYLLQGAFADTAGPDHQLHWLLENARMVRSLGGLGEIYSAIKLASWKHDYLSSLPDHIPSRDPSSSGQQGPANAPLLTPEAKLEYLDEINLELALHFAQLYSLIEASRGDEEWGDELMSLDPPLPIFLFGLVASLREKSAKGYPVKKLLLLLWKSLLSCLGGLSDVERCKYLAREIEGLGPVDKTIRRNALKANPLDLQDFQQEITAKYPTFEPPKKQSDDLPLDKLASAIQPIPPRKPFSSHLDGPDARAYPGGPQQGPNGMMPGTPAPSPPPSPKPNKAKYQTDQTRPFIFPYSRSVQGDRLVPYSIDEASSLFKEHMHVSLELWQTWRIREQCIQEESGVGSAADGTRIGLGVRGPTARAGTGGTFANRTDAASSSQGSRSPTSTEAPVPFPPLGESNRTFKVKGEATYDHLLEIEEEIEQELRAVEADHMLAALDNPRHTELLDQLARKRADVRRLQRVDLIYRAVLPQLQSAVIVLLKLLLATITSINTNSAHAAAIAEGAAIDEAPPPTLEDVDVARHREILTKAVSAILLLCLKWFKASHVMKFNYLSQVLVDSNVLLLILKIFGLQELAHAVKTKNEADNFRFFNYCYLNGGREGRGARAEDSLMSRHNIIGPVTVNPGTTSPPPGRLVTNADGSEGEVVSDYSWRNFFSSINFTRILQKLSKRKVHRILLLVQYKSSAILKRSLQVPHSGLELYVLKVIKSQVPFCGRKWRSSSMKVITSIYLNCRPDLKDEWLSGSDVEADVEDSLPQEQALRSLVKFYNNTRFGPPQQLAADAGHSHRRSISTHVDRQEGEHQQHQHQHQQQQQQQHHVQHQPSQQHQQQRGANGEAATSSNGDESHPHPAAMSPTRTSNGNSFFESDVLPPLRRTHHTSTPGGYIPDDVVEGYLDTYEDVLGEVFGENVHYPGDFSGGDQNQGQGDMSGWSSGKWGLTHQGALTAWNRLGEILGENIDETDSNSSTTHSSNNEYSGDGSTNGSDGGSSEDGSDGERDENRNDWEHLSPKEMRYLTSGVLSPSSPSPIPLHGGAGSKLSPSHSPLMSPKVSHHSSSLTSGGLSSSGDSALDMSPSNSPVRPFTIISGPVGVNNASGGGAGGSTSGGVGGGSSSSSSSRPGSRRNSRSNSDSSPLRPVITDWKNDDELDNLDLLAKAEQEGTAGLLDDEEDGDGFHLPLPNPKAGGIDEVEHIFGT